MSPEGVAVGVARRLALDPPAWAAPVFGFEVEISEESRSAPRYQSLPSTPVAWRDINLVLPDGAGAADAVRLMGETVGRLLESVEVISEFRAPGLGEGARAVQFRLTFRAPDRTVRDEEVDAAVGRALKALEAKLGARLRST
jgi:phenylalanyl-tRNA synthetase beta chain